MSSSTDKAVSELKTSHPTSSYDPPRIEHKGRLKQFAGSPLSPKPNDPLDILGLGD